MDAASDATMVTYIGGLHSPPVSQPTAIHQDIQLGGEEGDGPTEPLRWVVSGQDQGLHGSGDAPQLRLEEKEPDLFQFLQGAWISCWTLS